MHAMEHFMHAMEHFMHAIEHLMHAMEDVLHAIEHFMHAREHLRHAVEHLIHGMKHLMHAIDEEFCTMRRSLVHWYDPRAMETPYTGEVELNDVQRHLLLELLAGPMLEASATARGLDNVALQLRDSNLTECVPKKGWRLTPDGGHLAEKIQAGWE